VLAARATALEGCAERSERLERFPVVLRSLALILDATVPLKTKRLERPQDPVGRAAAHARAIEILHAHEPAPATAARIRVAAERGDERSKVECPGGRGRKAPDILVIYSGRRGRRTGARVARDAPAPRC